MAEAAGVQTNEAERRRWNDAYWSTVWPRREQLTNAVTEILLEHLRLQVGERVLDVGSGGGLTSIEAGRLVGATGSVLGADISEALVALGRHRVEEQGVINVDFVVADVQHDRFERAPFDVAMSQFGVMFFDEPAVAFRNILDHVTAGGRLGFACWQPIERNAWHIGNAIGPYLPSPPAPAPGKSPTSPFSLDDPVRTAGLLEGVGWSEVAYTTYEKTVVVERDAIVDDDQASFMGVPEVDLDEARASLERHLAGLRRSDGRFDVPIAFQVVTASRPPT
jgi:SAM-dependent methyltransferase